MRYNIPFLNDTGEYPSWVPTQGQPPGFWHQRPGLRPPEPAPTVPHHRVLPPDRAATASVQKLHPNAKPGICKSILFSSFSINDVWQ